MHFSTTTADRSNSPPSFDGGINTPQNSRFSEHRFPLSIDSTTLLGKGCFGGIYQAYFHIELNRSIVVKLIENSSGADFFYAQNREDLEAENTMLTALQGSPGIVSINPKLFYKGESYSFLVLDRYECSLDKALPNLDLNKIKSFFYQIVQGLTHCHNHNIAHCDIQLSNCLIREDECVLADFGNASDLEGHLSSGLGGDQKYYPRELCTSLELYGEYNQATREDSSEAPTLLKNLHKQRCSEDIYALSILAREMFKGYLIDAKLETLLKEMQSANRFDMNMKDILKIISALFEKDKPIHFFRSFSPSKL
jgi:serine/threonine protein kinase